MHFLHRFPHLERYFLGDLAFAHLENVDEAHLDLRSNGKRNGMGTDQFEADDAVVDHSIFRAFHKGALGMMRVEGNANANVFAAIKGIGGVAKHAE